VFARKANLVSFLKLQKGQSSMAEKVVKAAAVVGALKAAQHAVTAVQNFPEDPAELVWSAKKVAAWNNSQRPMRVIIVGSGITGIAAMKACLQEGVEFDCFEASDDVAGFWRYKENDEEASVYRSVYIDTPRDVNSYGDLPYKDTDPAFLHNSRLCEYLMENVEEFGLRDNITFHRRVSWITHGSENLYEVQSVDTRSGATYTDNYDAVMVASGRHGSSGFIPFFPGMDKSPILQLHSSKYKYPEKHGINKDSVAVVVGVGNSGLDIASEIGDLAKKTYLVSRSGVWVSKHPPGEELFNNTGVGRLTIDAFMRLPWWWCSKLRERVVAKDQAVLNDYGLKPSHRMLQQHEMVTGLHGRTIHSLLEEGKLVAKKQIDRFENGKLYLRDTQGDVEAVDADIVVYATGFRSAAGFVDPEIMGGDGGMMFNRKGNDLPLYKGFLSLPREGKNFSGPPIAFLNFVQTATFLAAELQSRYYVRVLSKQLKLPPPVAQKQQIVRTTKALAAQYLNREQLRNQHGIYLPLYYDELAEDIGNLPTFLRLLFTRPTALWHFYFGVSGLSINAFQYRLIGPHAYKKAEVFMEKLYQSTTGGFYVAGPKKGQKKPFTHWLPSMIQKIFLGFLMHMALLYAKLKGFATSNKISDRLGQNLAYMTAQREEHKHSLELGHDSEVLQQSPGGAKIAVFESWNKNLSQRPSSI